MEWWPQISCDPDSLLAPRRPNVGGGTPFPYVLFSCSPCVLVIRADCTLLGRLCRWKIWTCLRWGRGSVSVWKSSHRNLWLVWFRGACHGITFIHVGCSIWVTLICIRSPYPNIDLDSRAFWPLEPSRDLKSSTTKGFLRPIPVVGGEIPWTHLAKQSRCDTCADVT